MNALEERLVRLCSIPSHAASHEGTEHCANYLAGRLREVGCQHIEIHDEPRAPIVEGHLETGPGPTLIVYGMYDTREPTATIDDDSPSVWLEETPETGRRLCAASPLGYKPSLELFLTAVENAVNESCGDLPNLIFVFEGDEINGSRDLKHWVENNRSKLKEATAVFWPRPMQHGSSATDLFLGYKGMMGLRITASGRSWGRGPTEQPLHTQHRVWIDSPAWRLVSALNCFVAEVGNNVQLPVFAHECILTAEEQERLRLIAKTFNREGLESTLGVRRFVGDLSDYELLTHYSTQPSVNLELERCMSAGVGLLHEEASAVLQFRSPAPITMAKVLVSLRQHLDSEGFEDLKLEVYYMIDGSKTRYDAPVVEALLDLYESYNVAVRVWPMSGATAPIVVFSNVLGIDFIDGGLGRTSRSDNHEIFDLSGSNGVASVEQICNFYRDFLIGFCEISK